MSEKPTGGPYRGSDLPAGATDWERLDATTEEEIEAQAAEDGSTWSAAELAHAELVMPTDLDAEREMAKAELSRAIADAIQRAGLTQMAAAERAELGQPDISNIIRGNVARFSLERLTRVLIALGQDVEIYVRPGQGEPRGHLRVTAA
jgi:predicted XRE-type DNA-binding protein